MPFVKNDLEDVRKFLLSSGGFDTVYVAREKIVNRDLIEDYVRNKFAKWLDRRDRFLFYYSGHGDDSSGKTGYMQFARPNNFAGPQVLAINDASDWSSEMPQNHQLFVFDCCASGLAFGNPKGDAGDAYSQMIETLSRNGSRPS
ncbi:MAG: caspase family protein [bacterium]